MHALVKMRTNCLIGLGFYPRVPNDLMDGFSGWTLDSLENVRFLLNGAETGQGFLAADLDPQIETFFGTYDYVVHIGYGGLSPRMFVGGGGTLALCLRRMHYAANLELGSVAQRGCAIFHRQTPQ